MSAENKSIRVRRMIEDIEKALETQTPAQISANETFVEYQKEFPKLFEMLIARTYNRDYMTVMIEQLERMERGATNQHDASVAVGTMLVDRIVKPQLRSAGKKV